MEADELFRGYASEIAAAIRRIERGEFDRLKDGIQAVKDLRSALRIVFEERARVAQFDEAEGGCVAGAALDLDAARDEICRRLARLREAGGCG
ncbi:hypothetical protein R5H32_03940 [Defluviimonas sp. D31]|uniref:hypothetical protein n=1 Tax=Defluviimonas sp. D31 TaxID=3083253 RepID=UPI00296E2810|nr:hypothetical protein [Defluviimonas sp. D31]MDW4548498.1 hypothetical protein [Defluviimonas sp. D31]